MITIWVVISVIVISSLVIGIIGSLEVDVVVEFKRFSNGYFTLGASFNEYTLEDPGYMEQELVIGLFFVNIKLVFYKENDA